MNSLLRKQLQHPIIKVVKQKGKIIAKIFFYSADYPTFKTKQDRYLWWEIAEYFVSKERGSLWKEMTDIERYSDIDGLHTKMFPEWIKKINKKRIHLVNVNDIFTEIKKIVLQNYKTLPLHKTLKINVYPRIVLSKKNHGCNGYAIRSSYMLSLFIDGNRGWKQSLRSSFAHEYMHLLYRYPYDNQRTFTELCVREGLAIHFAEYRNGKHKGDCLYLTYKQTAQLLQKNKYWLNRILTINKKVELYKDSISPPHSVGYVIVGLFLDSLKTISWQTIMRIPPKEIMHIAQLVLQEKIKK